MPDDKRTKIGPTGPIRPVTGFGAAASATPAPVTPAPVTPVPVTESGGSSVHFPPQVDPLLGQTLAGRYLIQRKLGEGGMGAVYLATHNLLEKHVALKVLHGEFARKPDLVERFMQEAKSASRIRHENVIDISDFGHTPEGLVFFAMELLKGHDLHEEIARARLAGQRLTWDRSRRIFLQICSALSAAHALGIVHRDLKPENIYLVDFLGEPDFVKLLDFGIAKLTEVGEGDRKLTRTGMLFGTPEYMSPEQARGESVDHRVDVYAMGCILYQLVTGRVPFEAENFMGVLTMHLTQPPPVIPPEALDAIGAPRAIAGVIDKALAKDRNQRFASIDELARAVRRVSGDKATGPVTAQHGVSATGSTAELPRARTQWTGNLTVPEHDSSAPRRSSRLPLILGGVVVVAGLGGVIGYLATRGGSGPAPAAPAAEVTPHAPPAPPAATPGRNAPPSDALAFDRAQIHLESVPPGADVRDLASDSVIGHTPFTFSIPASRTARRFALHRKDYMDAVVELVPDHERIDYTEKLVRGRSAPGAVPVVHKPEPAPTKVEPQAPVVKPDVPAAIQEPPGLQPAPAPIKPEPEPAHPASTPAAPVKQPRSDDDCGEPPCLKADPSRQGQGGNGSGSTP